MEKVQVTQDTLYQYLTDHGVKLVRLAELTGLSEASINVCFKHSKGTNGQPRVFTQKAVDKINGALPSLAKSIRQSVLTFGSEETFTNLRGTTYDPALVEPLKKIGDLMNLTSMVNRVLGWNKDKKENTLVSPSSKNYGNISKEDADRVNAELLAVAGVLSSYEVVIEESKDNSNKGTHAKEDETITPTTGDLEAYEDELVLTD